MTKKNPEVFTLNTRQSIRILESLLPETRVYMESSAQGYELEYAGTAKDVIEVFRHPEQPAESPHWNTTCGYSMTLHGMSFCWLHGISDLIPSDQLEYCVLFDYNISSEENELPSLAKEEPKGPSRRKLLPRAFH